MLFRIYSDIVYFFSKVIFTVTLKLFFNFRVTGGHNIPPDGSFILASNHASYVDPAVIGSAIQRRLHFVTGDHLYENRPAGLWYNSVDCIRIRRGEADHKAIRKMLRYTDFGKPIVIFPEGTRSHDGKLNNAFPGIGFIAYKSDVPVIPVFIEGSDKVLPRGATRLKRHPVRAYIGSPISNKDVDGASNKKEAYRLFSKKIMDNIARLGAERGGRS